MLKPEKFNLRQAWMALQEARRGNGISQHIYNRFAEASAMPLVGEPECNALRTYEDFARYHMKIWYTD